jgi:mono/diheme cytochrome c family protein
MPSDCSACHTDSHRYQRLLTVGKERPGIMSSPDPMYKARTNCLGCHNEQGMTEKGHSVLTASDKSCVQCHTEGHGKVLASWKNEVKEEIEHTLQAEKKALAAMDRKQGALSPENLKKMKDLLAKGRSELDIVRLGNGVHNFKYSILLLDSALTAFEEVTEMLKAGQ